MPRWPQPQITGSKTPEQDDLTLQHRSLDSVVLSSTEPWQLEDGHVCKHGSKWEPLVLAPAACSKDRAYPLACCLHSPLHYGSPSAQLGQVLAAPVAAALPFRLQMGDRQMSLDGARNVTNVLCFSVPCFNSACSSCPI